MRLATQPLSRPWRRHDLLVPLLRPLMSPRSKWCGLSQRALSISPPARLQRQEISKGHEGDQTTASQLRERQLPIAVLGGGLGGLTTAFYLARQMPHRRIILFESSNRLGGWLRTETHQLPRGNGQVTLEAGPRSIRPKGAPGWTMIEMIHSLKLMDELIVVPSSVPSAKNRYIYFGSQLNKLPTSLGSMLASLLRLPVLRSLLPFAARGLLGEFFRPSRFARPKSESAGEVMRQRQREHLLDESVESFVRRRFGDGFGSQLTNNMLSAVLHGIYAADAGPLSVRSTLPFLWRTEQQYGSLMRALMPIWLNRRYRSPTEGQQRVQKEEADVIHRAQTAVGPTWTDKLGKASVFSLKEGLESLIRTLVTTLLGIRNVSIRTSESVTGLQQAQDGGQLFLRTQSGEDVAVTTLVSTIPSAKLADLLEARTEPSKAVQPLPVAASTLSLLRHNPSTDVGVVSFAIPELARPQAAKRKRLVPTEEAFGFLIPRAEAANNPDGILGVVFDSDAIPGQDHVSGGGAVTKLTVMMGGPHWRRLSQLPDEEECKQGATRALERFLSIPPIVSNHPDTIISSRVQQSCIPTYLPGHHARMRRLHEDLSSTLRRVAVAGASSSGVSVNDVVYHARKTAEVVARREEGATETATGLEWFTND